MAENVLMNRDRRVDSLDAQLRQRFLDLGRTGPSRREACDLAGLVSESVDLLRPQCLHAGIELAWRVRDRLAGYSQLRLANASADAFYGGLVSFEPVKGDLKGVLAECTTRNIRTAGSPQRIRVATHVFTQPTELNAFFDAVERGLRG